MNNRKSIEEIIPGNRKEIRSSHSRKGDFSQNSGSFVDRIMSLQRTIGNKAVDRLINSGIIQTRPGSGSTSDVRPNLDQVQVPSVVSSPLIQRTKVCSKRLDNPLGRLFNHSYIDDTGSDDCLGKSKVGNYAIQTLHSGNFLKGCAIKTNTSTDPQEYTPNVKQCDAKPGVKDLSKCLLDAYNSYNDPSLYKNPSGPNSNTFAATLAKTCCADGSSKGLGLVPGWDATPAPPCPEKKKVFVAGSEEPQKEEVET